jgi:hypothetical protein
MNIDWDQYEIVCKVGVSLPFYEAARPWLDRNESHRLFFLDEEQSEVLFNDRRVRVFSVESPLQKEPLAKKIGALSAFKKLLVIGNEWKGAIEEQHLIAQMVGSDLAQFGTDVVAHLLANRRKKLRTLPILHKPMPALVIGAGPSLESNGHLLKTFKDRALLIAAGTAINTIDVVPHLAVAIDPHIPLIRKQFHQVPLCIQSRVHPETSKGVKGDLYYIPDCSFPFEPWFMGGTDRFDGGWTVGNTAVSVAQQLGCNPIVLVGMDYCYQDKRKYAHGKKEKGIEHLVSTIDAEGNTVLTQLDWLLSVRWLEQFAATHPNKECWNGTARGMAISGFPHRSLEEFHWPVQPVEWGNSQPVLFEQKKIKQWETSLLHCRTDTEEDEIARELLLDPLWNIWKPLFERELMTDPEPLSMEEKLAIQKMLFTNQIIDEHLHALRTRR